MATMGRYCKAYPVPRLREFPGWKENTQNLRPAETSEQNGQDGAGERVLTDNDHLYLQENYVVTDGIFMDEHIVFDDVTPEWIEFCQKQLNFEIPVYEPVQVKAETN